MEIMGKTYPIIVEQDRLTLTIEQIVADTNKTVISYHIDNLPTTGTPSCCYNDNQLQLPDGTALLPIGSEVTCEQTYSEARVEFMPLPEGVTQATLLTNLKFPEAACTALPAWEVAFSLGSTKPANIEFLPVMDEPTETNGSNSLESTTETAAEATQSDVRFIVDHSVTLEDGYLLYGHIEYADVHWIGVGLNGTSLSGTDATGKAVPLKLSTESILDNEFVIEVATKDFAAPLTLHVQSLWISAKYENLAVFSFDAGMDPQVGQSWDLNQEIDLAGNKITILSVQVTQEPADVAQDTPNKGYGIEFNTATEYFNGQIICEGQGEATAAWGQSRAFHGTNLLFETYYSDGIPHGLVSCRFWHVHYLSPGSWQFDWQPPDPNE